MKKRKKPWAPNSKKAKKAIAKREEKMTFLEKYLREQLRKERLKSRPGKIP